ncbi:MAG: hypothetical protein P9M08_02870 [Candidatus Erginobacter occultus]|nr:hypothetical protein [Candidatus Erginobacter occultus]
MALDTEEGPVFSAEGLKEFSLETGFGGVVEMFSHGGRTVIVITRSLTSGTRSSDLHVFIENRYKLGYRRVLHRAPIWGSHLKIFQAGDTLTVKTVPKDKTLLTFSISGCYNFVVDSEIPALPWTMSPATRLKPLQK